MTNNVNFKRFIPQGAMQYDPKSWEGVKANCYSYVAGLRDAGIATPGALSREFLFKGSEISVEVIRKGLMADKFEEIRRHSRDPKEDHIIDVYFNPERLDIHPYHLHEDYSYSHLRAYSTEEDVGEGIVLGTQNFITRRHFDGLGLKIKRAGFDARRLGYVEHVGCFAMSRDGIDYIPVR